MRPYSLKLRRYCRFSFLIIFPLERSTRKTFTHVFLLFFWEVLIRTSFSSDVVTFPSKACDIPVTVDNGLVLTSLGIGEEAKGILNIASILLELKRWNTTIVR